MTQPYAAGSMIGFVPRTRPTIKVKRYNRARMTLIELCDRQKLIEAIAAYLHIASRDGVSLQRMYGERSGSAPMMRRCGPPRDAGQIPRRRSRARRAGATSMNQSALRAAESLREMIRSPLAKCRS